jgi:hypothetical protein
MVVLGLGMAVSVAPLTTVVLSSVAEGQTGAASGVNNAVSQVAGLLALALFAPIFFHVFSPSLTKRLDRAGVPVPVAQQVEEQRARLGAIETDDQQAREAVDRAFVTAFRVVTLLASGLAVAASLSAAATIRGRARDLS